MEIQNIANSQNFEGRLFIIGKFSPKPKQSIDKLYPQLEELIKPKGFDLYLRQDYGACNVNMACRYMYLFGKSKENSPQTNVPITATASKYISAAKRAIDLQEQMINKKEQEKWENKQKQQRKEDIKDAIASIPLVPLFIIGRVLREISPKLSKKFENLLDEII